MKFCVYPLIAYQLAFRLFILFIRAIILKRMEEYTTVYVRNYIGWHFLFLSWHCAIGGDNYISLISIHSYYYSYRCCLVLCLGLYHKFYNFQSSPCLWPYYINTISIVRNHHLYSTTKKEDKKILTFENLLAKIRFW